MLTLTDRAAEVLTTVCEPGHHALRIMVLTGGCAGLQYRMGLEAGPSEDDEVLNLGKLTVLVDKPSTLWLAGTTVDYVEAAEGSGFVFHNPNSGGKCSCAGSCG